MFLQKKLTVKQICVNSFKDEFLNSRPTLKSHVDLTFKRRKNDEIKVYMLRLILAGPKIITKIIFYKNN